MIFEISLCCLLLSVFRLSMTSSGKYFPKYVVNLLNRAVN